MRHKLKAFSSVADGTGSRNTEENLRLHNKFLLSFVKPNSSTLRQDKITVQQKWVLQSKSGRLVWEELPCEEIWTVGTERRTWRLTHILTEALDQEPD